MVIQQPNTELNPHGSAAYEQFSEWVRSALRQLYDAPSLETHPLARLLQRQGGDDLNPAQKLRRRLLDAIQEQRPAANVPANSPDWRAYRILELRYLESLSAAEAMEALALQKSQFFRDQARAVAHLVDSLWRDIDALDLPAQMHAPIAPSPGTDENPLGLEMQRLASGAVREQVDLAEVLEELRSVWEPLANARGARVQLLSPQPIQLYRASRVMVRQAILNLLACAIEHSHGDPVQVSTWASGVQAGVWVKVDRRTSDLETVGRSTVTEERLQICRHLVDEMRGALEVSEGPGARWEARLSWAREERPRLLVIDDNQGFEELFRRFLAGHGWQVVGAASGAEARETVANTPPTVITVDVLMPQEDGWELLMALKSNPETREIPVIVCSVLHEPQLALSLGAAAYLPKPVTEESLLRVLSPWTAASASSAPEHSG